ncbi:MAG: (2Fe-2S)-binding protein [Nannocystaceae bacterium]
MSQRTGQRGGPDVVVCHCNTVTVRQVIACARRGAHTLEAIGVACDAGIGCGSCRGAILTILDDEAARRGRGEGPPAALLQLPLFGGRGRE